MEDWFSVRLEPSGIRQLKVDIPFNGREFSLWQLRQHPRDFQLKGKEGRKREEENQEHHAWRFASVMPTVVRLGWRSTSDLRSV